MLFRSYLVMGFLSSRRTARAHQQSDKLQQALKHVTSAIQNIETVKCFNGEWFELRRYATAISSAGNLFRGQARFRSAQLGFMQFYSLSIFFQGFWYGSYLVATGKETPGNVVTTFWGAMMAVQGITEFLPQLIVLQKGKVAGARLRAVMLPVSKSGRNEDNAGGKKPDKCAGDVRFEGVRRPVVQKYAEC